jgi:hypothetical protein
MPSQYFLMNDSGLLYIVDKAPDKDLNGISTKVVES